MKALLNANLLRAEMVAAGKTQEQLAREIGVSPNTLSSAMVGRRSFNIREVDAICRALGITDGARKIQIFLA